MSCLLLRQPHRPVRRFSPALCLVSFGLLSTLCFPIPSRASSADEAIPSPEVLAQLEQRASQASPREQCFLYTELVHSMTAKAGKEISDGETDQAAATLKKVNFYAHLIHLNLARDTKRLKNAEMLMHNTTYRLGQYLHLVSGDDKVTVQDTLKQLDQVNDELLSQVFSH
ncbi:MAG TPA: hypothetical protein VGN01_17265 [Acidobacteriaceae bacterium]|jgi:hypothetical protein